MLENNYDNILWEEDAPASLREKTCPLCSQRLSDLMETYFVGCPMCYQIFKEEIEKLAINYHGKCEHFGKTPKRNQSRERIEKELNALAQEEKEAVRARDYVRAEEIKRKISLIKGERYGGL